jgi:hypothetical protein
MNPDYVGNEIARMRVGYVASKTRLRCADVLAELLLARMRAKVDDLCNRRTKLRTAAQGKGTR